MGGLIFGSGIVYGSTFLAKDVTYTPDDSSFNVNNVGSALDKLYEMDKISETISNSECISGSFICGANCAGSNGQLIESEFEPSKFIIFTVTLSSSYGAIHFFDKSDMTDKIKAFQSMSTNTVSVRDLSTYYTIKNKGLYAHNFGSDSNNRVWYYFICK